MSDYFSKHHSKADLDALREQGPAEIHYPGGTCTVCGEKCSKIVSQCEPCFENRRYSASYWETFSSDKEN